MMTSKIFITANVENPRLTLNVSILYGCESSSDSPCLRSFGLVFLFMPHTELLCPASIWWYRTVCFCTCGQGNTSVGISDGEHLDEGWVSSFQGARFMSQCCSWLPLHPPIQQLLEYSIPVFIPVGKFLKFLWPQMSSRHTRLLCSSFVHFIVRPQNQKMTSCIVLSCS